MVRINHGALHYSQIFGVGDPACSSSSGPSMAPEFVPESQTQHPPSNKPDCGT